MFSTFSSISSILTKKIAAIISSIGLGTNWANVSTTLNVASTSGCCSTDRAYVFGIFSSVLYVSTDLGSSWTNMQSRISNLTPAWVICSQTGQYVYVRTTGSAYNWVSNDYGATFTSYNVQTTGPNLFIDKTGQYAIQSSNQISATKGVYVSSNYGVTWTNVGTNMSGWGTTLTARHFNSACICQSTPSKIMISSGTGEGVFYSSDFGSSWTLCNPAGTSAAYIVGCIDNGTFYAIGGSSVYYTSNPTSGWTALSVSGMPTPGFNIISGGGSSIILHNATAKAIWYSLNNGTSWASNSAVPGATQTTNGNFVYTSSDGLTFATGWNTTTKNMWISY
jgi:hypothetical protein